MHKWVMWIIGLQFLIWSLSGLYFSAFDIHYIHGETLHNPRHAVVDLAQVTYPFHQLLEDYPNASDIALYALTDSKIVYRMRVKGASKARLVDAQTGELQATITQQQALKIAKAAFSDNSNHNIQKVIYLSEDGPSELAPRHLPVWQIQFDDPLSSTLYISQTSGEVVTRRHDGWRLFDLFWRLHILDPFEGENISNPWLLIAALVGLFSLFTGLFLTWYSLLRPAIQRRRS